MEIPTLFGPRGPQSAPDFLESARKHAPLKVLRARRLVPACFRKQQRRTTSVRNSAHEVNIGDSARGRERARVYRFRPACLFTAAREGAESHMALGGQRPRRCTRLFLQEECTRAARTLPEPREENKKTCADLGTAILFGLTANVRRIISRRPAEILMARARTETEMRIGYRPVFRVGIPLLHDLKTLHTRVKLTCRWTLPNATIGEHSSR